MIDADFIYDITLVLLSVWGLVMTVALMRQSVPRIRQTAPTWQRRLRMGTIVFTLMLLAISFLINSVYSFTRDIPTDPILILLTIIPRTIVAVILTILVFTKPEPEATLPPDSPEDWADFREWQRWRKHRNHPPSGQ